jgi:nucleoside-diphosphate-sugar epimerase
VSARSLAPARWISLRPCCGDIRDSLANIDKAKKYLGYEPVVKAEKGLEVTLNWFKTKNPQKV